MMPDCIPGVPREDGSCSVVGGVYPGPLVVRKFDGSIELADPNDPIWRTRGTLNSGPTYLRPYSFAAMRSAWAMLEEHDQRILDSNQIPAADGRGALWLDYYNVSRQQFRDDAKRLAAGQPPELTFSADGIAPYGPERLADIALAKSLGRLKTADQLALDEIIRVYGPGRTAANISAKLATNPYAARFVQAYLDAQLPAANVQIQIAEDDGGVVVTSAPPAAIGDISQGVKRDPSLPASSSNTQTYDEAIARAARQASQVVALYPEEYLKDDAAAAKQQAELRDFFYWKANFPTVQILAEYNPAFNAGELNTPWDYARGNAPLVNVTFTPRIKPPPEKSFLAKNPLLSQVLGIVALAIPAVGPVISAGISYETNRELRTWAQSWQPNSDEFAPQYAPPNGHGGEPFNVPMPLDRAQIMLREPWYGPAMVDQFAEEIRVNQLRQASANYAVLLQNAATARAALAAAGTNALTTSSNAAPAQGAANIKGTIPSSSIHAPAGGALPILAAGLLLVLGAPVVVPIGVLVLLGGKK
jgi:hypothetical protein